MIASVAFKATDIQDGTSQTILFGETLAGTSRLDSNAISPWPGWVLEACPLIGIFITGQLV